MEKATKAWHCQRCQCACGYGHFLIHTYIPGVEALVNEDSETRCWCVSDDNPPPSLTSC